MPTKKATTKLKTKTTTKAKLVAKPKAKPKLVAKPKAKASATRKSPLKAKKTRTTKTKSTRTVAKKPLTAKARAKTKTTSKAKLDVDFTGKQKAEIVSWVGKFDELHKHDKEGLKSLTKIDEILRNYNQHYKEVNDKFAGIIKVGIEKDPRVANEYFYMVVNGRDQETTELYELLAKIGHHEIKFDEAKAKIKDIFTKTVEHRHRG